MALIVQILGLALHVQPAGQRAAVGQALLNGRAHGVPDLEEKVPDLRALVLLHIVADAQVVGLAVVGDFGEGLFPVDLGSFQLGAALDADVAAADAHHAHEARALAAAESLQLHGVGVGEGQRRVVVPDDFGGNGREGVQQHPVGAVAAPGERQRAVQRCHKAVGLGMLGFEQPGGLFRPHGVGAGRPLADFVDVANGFHGCRSFPFNARPFRSARSSVSPR